MPTKQLTPQEFQDLPWLQVYAQYAEHGEARILGTKNGLLALRDAIDRAIADKNGEAEAEAIVAADGEGYAIEVRRLPRSALARMSAKHYYLYAVAYNRH